MEVQNSNLAYDFILLLIYWFLWAYIFPGSLSLYLLTIILQKARHFVVEYEKSHNYVMLT